MLSLARHLIGVLRGRHPIGSRRSPKWRAVRAQHLKTNPYCRVCGGTAKLEVHHKVPFHMNPKLELDPYNLITLCESKRLGVTCHQWFGHLGDYRRFNPTVTQDADQWHRKVRWS